MVILNYPGAKAQVFVKGEKEPLKFCSVKDGFVYVLQPENAKRTVAFWVSDFGNKKDIPLHEKMLTADVIVFATPIYYYEMSGQMKTLLDRANALFASDYAFRDIYLLTAAAEEEYMEDPQEAEKIEEALLAQGIPEADRVAQALDLYVNGSLNFFNHRTTVDIRNRLVCFDIKGLGKNLKKPGMLIVQDAVWNTVTINRAIGRSTWYFVDEFHLLLKEEQTAAYSAEIWKRFRKWGGVPTGATQNPKDLLSSPEIENILENSDFIYMLNQAAGDRKILAERLGISAEQLAYVTNSEPGHGLLFFNNVILPFADDFPKDTELYKLLTTKPSEVEHAAETEE